MATGYTTTFWQHLVKEKIMFIFKEFYEKDMFVRSLNTTFFVLVLKKWVLRIFEIVDQFVWLIASIN